MTTRDIAAPGISSANTRAQKWRTLLPAGVAMALSLAGDLTLYAVLPSYAAGLGISLATIGILLSANRFIRLFTNPIVGGLADRVSRRKLVLTGLATGSLATLLYTLPGGFPVFLLGRLLWGVSWSMIYIGMYRMILDVTDAGDHGWGSGVLQTFYFVGLSVTPLLGSVLCGWLGFHTAILICVAVQGIGLVQALLFLPETRPAQSSIHLTEHSAGSWRAALRLLKNQEILTINYLVLLTLFIGDGIIMSTITLFLQQHFGDQLAFWRWGIPVASAGGAMLTLRALVSALGAPLGGRWSDRKGFRWPVALAGVALAIAGCFVLGSAQGFGLVVVGVIIASLGSSIVMAVLPAIAAEASAGHSTGLAMGLLANSGDIGCAVAPLISYTLAAALPLGSLYQIAGGLLATGLLAGLFIARRR